MKMSILIAAALAACVLLAVPAFAKDSTSKTILKSPFQINAILKDTPGIEGVKKVYESLTLRGSTADYDRMNCDLLSIHMYPNTLRKDYERTWRMLLVDLVDPGTASKLNASSHSLSETNFNTNANAILLLASQRGLNNSGLDSALKAARNTVTAMNHKISHGESSSNADSEIDKDRENYMYKFCRAMTYSSKQFLVANSTKYMANATAKHVGETETDRVQSQEAIVLSVLDLCKAHLGDARIVAASTLLSVATTVAVALCFVF